MVCLGNICRSPMAEGILRSKLINSNLPVDVDSAGTGNYHVGDPPDPRAIETARRFGVDISGLRGRQFTRNDFSLFDRIYVMDRSNLYNVISLAADDHEKEKVALILHASGKEAMEVPDPWYGGMNDFTDTFHLLDDACERIIDDLKKSYFNQ